MNCEQNMTLFGWLKGPVGLSYFLIYEKYIMRINKLLCLFISSH